MREAKPNLRTIFAEALEKESPEARVKYLDEACNGDGALRERVEALLSAHGEAGNFLGGEASEAGSTVDIQPITERPGDVVGRYKLLEEIGEGGFGVVFMAEQEEPLRRRVALKILKPGMDSRQVVARFEAERQALALMDHPGIARVYDAGATATGRPYFVMELVRGIPVTEYCDKAKLDCHRRLELFAGVCRAVQHAHQKGVIHRDLKPSNILVTLHDGTPVSKVIDFGVAKAMNQRLTERTLFTRFAQMVGTPLYMSPEQAELSGLDVDTRTDVYALGVLLYELLTGVTPFDKERFAKTSYDEIRRIIREEEPPTPSQRVSTLGDALAGVSSLRLAEPRKLTELLRGDLDWIAMKALEKDRARRYETASAFAQDIQRYLTDVPVEARPPSTWYRARKFVRRNRAALVIAACVLLTVTAVMGSVGLSLMERAELRTRITRDVEAALRRSSELREEGWLETQNPARWEAKLMAARSEIRSARSLLAGSVGLVDAALVARVRSLEEDLDADESDRSLVRTLERLRTEGHGWFEADAQSWVWDTRKAHREAFAAHGISCGSTSADEAAAFVLTRRKPVQQALIVAIDSWMNSPDSRTEPAKRKQEAEWLRSVLALADRDDWRREIRAAHLRKDRAALEAVAQQPETVHQPPASLFLLYRALKDCDATLTAINVYRRALERDPANFLSNLLIGEELRLQGSAEAVTFYRIARALRASDAGVHCHLGVALAQQKDWDGAIRSFRKATQLEPEFGGSYHNLARALAYKGDVDRAVSAALTAVRLKPEDDALFSVVNALLDHGADRDETMERVLRIKQLEPDHPAGYGGLGICQIAKGKFDEAVKSLERAIRLNPRRWTMHYHLATAFFEKGDVDAAIKSSRAALEYASGDIERARAYRRLGELLTENGEFDEAVDRLQASIDLEPHAEAYRFLAFCLLQKGEVDGVIERLQRWIVVAPEDQQSHYYLAEAWLGKQQFDKAADHFRRAIALEPNDAQAHVGLGKALSEKNDVSGAIDSWRRATKVDPSSHDAYCSLGGALRFQGALAEAAESLQRAIELKPDCYMHYYNLGVTQRKQGNLDDAIASYQKSIEIEPNFAESHANLGNALCHQGQLEKAVECLTTAIGLKPNLAEAHYDLGLAFLQQGHANRAIKHWKTVLGFEPDHAAAHNNLGAIFRNQGDLAAATWHLSEALRLDPHSAVHYYNLGVLLAAWKNDLEGAIRHYRKAIELQSDYAPAHYSLGYVLFLKNEFDGAIESYREALDLRPDYTMAHFQLGVARNRKGQFDEAIESLRRAIALESGHARAHHELGVALSSQGRVEEGIKSYLKALELQPSLASVRYRLARAHWELGRKEAAREWYAKAVDWVQANGTENAAQNEELRRLRARVEQLMGIDSREGKESQ